MMKKLLFLLPALGITGYLLISLLMYQRLVNEGSILADSQCLTINPIIIERKNNYLSSLEAAQDNDTAGYQREITAYFERSKQYVDEQSKWLKAQHSYMRRWDFQFFLPGYMRRAAQYQYDSRKADVESTKFLIDAFEVSELNPALSQELEKKSMELVRVRNQAEESYNELWDNPERLDWRTNFTRVPESKCPEENFDFPTI